MSYLQKLVKSPTQITFVQIGSLSLSLEEYWGYRNLLAILSTRLVLELVIEFSVVYLFSVYTTLASFVFIQPHAVQ